MKHATLALLAGLALSHAAQAASYNDVRSRVYATPDADLVTRPGITFSDFARAYLGLGGALLDRVRGTLSSPADFKPAKPKILHPMGVCAEAKWEITEESAATGLFAKGTSVRAIVRLSAGDKQTRLEKGKKRIFGIAVKLFPAREDSQAVDTANLFLLDQYGLDGSARASYLVADKGQSDVYFQNTASGGGTAGKLVSDIFGRFDSDPRLRPLYPLSEVTVDGKAIATERAVTPTLLRLVPDLSRTSGDARPRADFRAELMSYEPGTLAFTIFLPKEGRIGRLTLGKPVLSAVCDTELHFHHHPTR